ncbi:MAG: PspC domain-containing protein [Chloroflexota bacterium]
MRDRLYRSRSERVVFGVCGGIADWLDVDPSLVRIAFVLTAVIGGLGLLVYIVMAFVVPEEPFLAGSTTPSPASFAGSTDAAGSPPRGSGGEGWATDRAARRAASRGARRSSGSGGVVFGAILILVGGWFLARRYLPFLDGDFLGPLILVLVGILLIGGALRRSKGDGPGQSG